MSQAAVLTKSQIEANRRKADAEMERTFYLMDVLNSGQLEHEFNQLIQYMEQVYMQDNKPWLIMVSFGKDSALVLTLVLKMLERIPPEFRTKQIHIITADTKVETPQMTKYVNRNIGMFEGREEELNVKLHVVKPNMKNSYFWNVLGKGNVPPTPKSPFRWCTHKLKINPMDEIMESIIAAQPISLNDDSHVATMLLGTRLDESASRAASIRKFEDDDESLFGTHSQHSNVRVFHPIKNIKTDELWAYLGTMKKLPWGLPYEDLYAMYSDGATECPLTQSDKDSMYKSCGSGNSRNGCWTCLFSGKKDAMLETLIRAGEEEIHYLAEWKQTLLDIRNDVRYRQPLRKIEERRSLKEEQWDGDLFALLEDEATTHYRTYDRANKKEYEPGSFTIEIRKAMLEYLFYIEEQSGYELIEEEEVLAIIDVWNSEGYNIKREDLKAKKFAYDGAVVLNTDGSINKKETTNPFPVFTVRFQFREDKNDLINYVKERQILTNKSFYCYFLNKDYGEESKLTYNYLEFIVCKPFVYTQEKAHEEVSKWLYLYGVDGKMTKSAFNAGRNYLMLSAIEEGLKGKESIPGKGGVLLQKLIRDLTSTKKES
ncbi:hypothetical protein bcgnr5390_16340 [Bacillus luti]|nr:hypothetical protein BC2903_53600 [Bacillus cereus]